MATRLWSPGELITPGDLRQPRTTPPVVTSAIQNPGFETGDLTSWTVSNAAITVVNFTGAAFDGIYVVRHPDGLLGTYFIDAHVVPVLPGQTITAGMRYRRETNVNGRQAAAIEVRYFDSGMVDLNSNQYFEQAGGAVNVWYNPAVTTIAPPTAAFAQLRIRTFQTGTGGTHHQYFDGVYWDYIAPVAASGLVYKAVQANAGYTASTEPVWPLVLGNTVVDNEVTWEAVIAASVTWEATPIMKSGTVEPTFPTDIGATVLDGTMAWTAVSRRIEDERCPNSRAVVIAASKIFAGDEDIIAYSATINPLDWSTPDDAGYLPFGLNIYGSNPVAALGLYRSNLVAFNSEGFQMWQVDQDPANMAFLDGVPVGSTYQDAIQALANDSLFLTAVGVRNIGIAGASTNLQAKSVGNPIDVLVKAKIAAGEQPISLYDPNRGQYWLIFGDEAFVLTVHDDKRKSWSRYTFSVEIVAAVLHGSDLLLRTDTDLVWRVNDEAVDDDEGTPSAVVTITIASPAVVSWTAHGAQNGDRVSFTTTGALPTGLAISTTYYVVNRAADTFEVSATAGGASINTSGTQSGVHTANIVSGTPFVGIIQWPHLDCGAIGVDKGMVGFDVVTVAPEGLAVSVGYNQKNLADRTADFDVDEDTLTGGIVPLPLTAPSFDLRLTFEPSQKWTWSAANLWLQR